MALQAYRWLFSYLAQQCVEKLRLESGRCASAFEARNNSQVYYCRSLALAYIEVCAFLALLSILGHFVGIRCALFYWLGVYHTGLLVAFCEMPQVHRIIT